ncbi:MerR family transcriptional regulator [Litorimonas sp.]|jgi:MerR family mercuric resistance operon transcriptional regulator|uniref:MerR family transcriptional regulator n=1 Tax=Litorimonas sp. TaxID=1892381 RepID=UPI003A87B53A
MKRGELAKLSGCNIETIRYYENIGILHAPDRTPAGHRVYSKDDQSRLRFILRTRELGFSIEEIRNLLSMVDANDYTCGDIHALTTTHLNSVSKKISDLQLLEDTLTRISNECGKGDTPDCPIIEALVNDTL